MSSNPPPAARSRLVRRLVLGGVLGLLVLGTCNTTFEYVSPSEVGIKESKFGGGIIPEKLPGGFWYVTGPGVIIHRFPTTTQAVEFTSTQSETARDHPDVHTAGRIEIDTTDGSKMHADVTVLFRVVDPVKVIKGLGAGRAFVQNAVVPRAQAALKENLGRLLAEAFYNEELRLKQTAAAQAAMTPVLRESGIEVEHVLIRQYYYAADYQRQIEQRKVQDQLVFTQQSRGESAKQDATKRKIIAEGEASVAIERRRGEAEITRIRAEADLASRRKHADGDLLVSLAQARGTELENSAYEGVGSENIVAENMAEVLKGLDVVILSDTKTGFNPLDMDSLLKLFGARGGAP